MYCIIFALLMRRVDTHALFQYYVLDFRLVLNFYNPNTLFIGCTIQDCIDFYSWTVTKVDSKYRVKIMQIKSHPMRKFSLRVQLPDLCHCKVCRQQACISFQNICNHLGKEKLYLISKRKGITHPEPEAPAEEAKHGQN